MEVNFPFANVFGNAELFRYTYACQLRLLLNHFHNSNTKYIKYLVMVFGGMVATRELIRFSPNKIY